MVAAMAMRGLTLTRGLVVGRDDGPLNRGI